MQYIKFGNSDLTVSRICMGCMGFGDANNGQHSWTIDEEHSREIIRRGLDLGVNFFDTAIAYQAEPASSILAGRFGSMQSVRMWWWRQNFFPALRMTSGPGLPDSSTLNG